jgi:hypothetical protein
VIFVIVVVMEKYSTRAAVLQVKKCFSGIFLHKELEKIFSCGILRYYEILSSQHRLVLVAT